MSKKTTLFSAASIFLLLLSAQTVSAQKFQGAYSFGINATQVDGDFQSGYAKLGLNMGVSVAYPLNDRWRISSEFLFTMKGARQRVEEDAIATIDFLKMSAYYLEIPFLLSYRYKKVFAEAGLSGGLLLAAFKTDFVARHTVTDLYKRGEIATHWGLGYEIDQKNAVFFRFSYSAAAVSKGPSGSIFVNAKRRPGEFHNVLTLGLRRSL
jgi:hypothetical protein